jgi:hypothetical protein
MASPFLRKLAKYARTIAKRSDVTWRYGMNLGPTLAYRLQEPSLSGETAWVADELSEKGVAVTSVQALLDPDLYRELLRAVDKVKVEWQDRLAGFRNDVNGSVDGKRYVISLLPETRALDPTEIYVRFALQSAVCQIVATYYGMHVSLRHCNLWHTFVTQQPPSQSCI